MSNQLKPNWHNDPDINPVMHVHHACLMGACHLQPETAGFERMSPAARKRLSVLVDQWASTARGLADLKTELLKKQEVTS